MLQLFRLRQINNATLSKLIKATKNPYITYGTAASRSRTTLNCVPRKAAVRRGLCVPEPHRRFAVPQGQLAELAELVYIGQNIHLNKLLDRPHQHKH